MTLPVERPAVPEAVVAVRVELLEPDRVPSGRVEQRRSASLPTAMTPLRGNSPNSRAGASAVTFTNCSMGEPVRRMTPSENRTSILVSMPLWPPGTLSTTRPESFDARGMVKSSEATVSRSRA